MNAKFSKAAATKAQRTQEAKLAAARANADKASAEFNTNMIGAIGGGAKAKGAFVSHQGNALSFTKALRVAIPETDLYIEALQVRLGNGDKTPGMTQHGTVGDALYADKSVGEKHIRNMMWMARKVGRALIDPNFNTKNSKGKEKTLSQLAASVDLNGKLKDVPESEADTSKKFDTTPKALKALIKALMEAGAFAEFLDCSAVATKKAAADASAKLKEAAVSYAAATKE